MRTQAARRRSLVRLWAGALGLALLGVAACAQAAPTPLDAYLGNLKTLRADFLQTLADAHGREIDRASGTLIVLRPGKFSWEIHPQNPTGASSGAGQLMVCDGTNLWFLDRDLQQVTVKPVDAALTATPAMLLSGAADVRKNFKITPAGERTGLSWVLVEPSAAGRRLSQRAVRLRQRRAQAHDRGRQARADRDHHLPEDRPQCAGRPGRGELYAAERCRRHRHAAPLRRTRT